MKLYIAYDEVAGKMIGIFSSNVARISAVISYFDYLKDDPEELALAVDNDIVYSEHILDEGVK